MNASIPVESRHFAAQLSTAEDTSHALREAVTQARAQLPGTPDWAVIFCSPHHADHLPTLLSGWTEALGTSQVIGCVGESIVGDSREIERSPALTVWLAQMPGVDVVPLRLHFTQSPDGGVIEGWPDEALESWPAGSALILLGDPYSFPADLFLARLNEDRPGTPVVGGMCSGMRSPEDGLLVQREQYFRDGAVGLLLRGDARLKTVVSQGCRPIGEPMVVTRAERNVIIELGGHSAAERLQALYRSLPTREQALARHGLHVGRVVSEYRDSFEPGDFLIRNVLALTDQGGIAIGDFIRPGQTVQFHLRDHETATADLRQMLARGVASPVPAPRGALIFTCNGRGTNLFPEPHHDARCLREAVGDLAVAGFFAAGELGPVGGSNFVHGFTASIGLFH